MPKILIVEDEEPIARTLHQRLERAGYEVVAAVTTGEDALQQVTLTPPDIVLMDMTLAGDLDGAATAIQIRERYNIPTVFLTANDSPETIARAKPARPLGYLLKPYQQNDLYRTLELAVYNHGVEQTLQARENQLHYLSDATQVLVSSLTPDTVLQRLAEFAVPRMGDFCLCDAVIDDVKISRLAAAHVDANETARLKRGPLSIRLEEIKAHAPAKAVLEKCPVFEPRLTGAWLAEHAKESPYLETLAALNCRSLICLPLIDNGKPLGVITFGFCGEVRHHTAEDLELGIELARRATIALEHALLYQQSLDQIHELQVSEQIIENLNHTLEQRVAQRTRELEQANLYIQDSLKEKEVLLQEVHHRVKNNLQVISSLLRMQLDRLSDPNASIILQESQNRIRSMAMIHEQLYRTRDMSRINLKSYLETLLLHLLQSYSEDQQKISYRLDADDIPIDLDTAIPCGLIATELISNALKHAFVKTGTGALKVGFKRAGHNMAVLSVEDNGAGMPPSIAVDGTPTLGFTILNALARQLRGELQIRPGTNSGTRIEIRLPLKPVIVKKNVAANVV